MRILSQDGAVDRLTHTHCCWCGRGVYLSVGDEWRHGGGANGGLCPIRVGGHVPLDLDDLDSLVCWLDIAS